MRRCTSTLDRAAVERDVVIMKRWFKLFETASRHLQAKERGLFVVVVGCMLIAAGCMAITPYILGVLTDRLLEGRASHDVLVLMAGAYLATVAMPRILQTVALHRQSSLRVHANRSLLSSYFNYLCEQPESFFTSRNSGELSQEVTQASNDLYVIIRNFSSSIISPIVQISIAIVILALNRDLIVAAAILIYAVLFLTNNAIQGRRLMQLRDGLMEAGRKSYATLSDSISNIAVARQYNGYDFLLSRYRAVLDEDRHAQGRYWAVSLQMQIINALLFVGFFGVSFGVALYGVVHGERSVGSMVLVGAYTLTLLAPIEGLGNMLTEITQSLRTFGVFMDKLESVRPSSRRHAEVVPMSSFQPAIEFDDVSLIYPGATVPALRGISFSIAPGQQVVITGPSGAGKTSIIKALTRQYSPGTGSIRLFGQDIATIDVRTLSDRVGYVSQEVLILKDTLRFNLKIARAEASDEEILHSLEKAGLGDLVPSLPAGLDTILGNRGATLSGGQRQRLALARLFLRKPDVVVIDEGTAALDIVTEQRVLEECLTTFDGKTIVIVTHRPSAMVLGDTLIVVQDGRVEDSGKHDELRSRNGFLSRVLSGAAS